MASFTIERNGDRCLVILAGSLTVAIVADLQRALLREIEQGAQEIVFNLEASPMIDSSGIGLIIAAWNSITKKNGLVQLINVSPENHQLFQSMRLEKRLNIAGIGKTEAANG